MGEMKHTFAIVNQKGGVGKTTVTLGLASAAAAAGDRVLVVDLDPQASSTWVLGIDPGATRISTVDVLRKQPIEDAIVPSGWSDRIDVLPADAVLRDFEIGKPKRLRRALGTIPPSRYDAILLDCPPSDANLMTNALTAARHAIVVVEPSSLGLRGLGALADSIDRVWDDHNPDLELSGVVVNRVPGVSVEADLRIAELGLIVGDSTIWRPFIPQRVILNRAVGERRSIHSFGVRGADSSAVFDRLWGRVISAVGH